MRILSIDPGRKYLGLCVLDVDAHERTGVNDTIVFWDVCDTPIDVPGLRRKLDAVLDAIAYDEVVIERQPPKNATMKRFEHLFEMYFSMHEKPVYIIDSRHKLTFASKTPFWTGGNVVDGKGSWSYFRRKKISVGTVTKFLAATMSRHDVFAKAFDRAQKKDDYSDSLLQAQAFAHVVKNTENAALEKIIKPRPFPKPRAPKPGEKITKANVVFFLDNCETEEDIEKELAQKTKIRNALTTHFGSSKTFLASRVRYREKNRKAQLSKLEPDTVDHTQYAAVTNDCRPSEESDRAGI